jgi:parallel beta-helix repeat protein
VRGHRGGVTAGVVDDDGGADFTSIQAAVNAASDGDTIEVASGAYVENVDVYKWLTLIGAGADVVTVQAASSNDHVFDVTADRVNITGFKVTGATGDGKAGIYVGSGIAHSNISNSAASNNYYGIYLDRSSNNILTENTPSKNSMHGIRLAYSSGNVLRNNIVSSDNGCAILLYASVDNRLINNDVSNSFQGIFMYTSSNDNVVSGNTASGNRQGGIYLEGNNNTITGNIASNNDDFGIALESSSNNTLYHNNLDGNTNNNAYDDGANQWDSGSEGNYYSDYTGTDSDGDGIGDMPYPISGGSSVDRYPLMEPWSEPTPTGSVHNINKGTDYTTIQAVIDDADIGDELHVDSGTYYENVVE